MDQKTYYLLLRWQYYPKGSISTIPIKILTIFFCVCAETEKQILNTELQVATKSQRILKNENTIEEFTLPHFKTHHKPTETKTLWYQHNQDMHTKPRNKPIYFQSTDLWQGCQNHLMGKEQLLQQMVLGEVDIHRFIHNVACISTSLLSMAE